MKNPFLPYFPGFLLIILCIKAEAAIEMPPIFTDGMVLQCEQPVRIWGRATPEAEVAVSFAGQTVEAAADKQGGWQVELQPLAPSSEPRALEIASSCADAVYSIRDVLVGEVWIAGGQSNMAFALRTAEQGSKTLAALDNPLIRFYTVPRVEGYESNPPNDAGWQKAVAGPQAAAFSAVAYFFAADLQGRLGVPIGIVSCNLGASSCEAWMSDEQLRKYPQFTYLAEDYDRLLRTYDAQSMKAYEQQFTEWQRADPKTRGTAPQPPKNPYNRKVGTALHRTMLSTVIPFAVRGAIWYQGEANANMSRGYEYRELFPAMIQSWREEFQNPEMPFYFVQLATFDWLGDRHGKTLWAELRESQLVTWNNVNNTGMVVAADHGEENDIHPKAKRPIGERLARFARRDCYGETALVVSGPIYRGMSISGQEIIIEFDHLDGGLVTRGELSDFEICAEDRAFQPANARIAGERLIVTSPLVNEPVAVRYGWKNWFEPSLFNVEGLPASPFRTDDFVLHTQAR